MGLKIVVYALVSVVVLCIGLLLGIGKLNSTDLEKLNTITLSSCKTNDGFDYMTFFPSSNGEVTIHCKNGAIFKDVQFKYFAK